jgi:hypothetical protein
LFRVSHSGRRLAPEGPDRGGAAAIGEEPVPGIMRIGTEDIEVDHVRLLAHDVEEGGDLGEAQAARRSRP